MSNIELQTLIQDKNNLNVRKVVEFIEKQDNRKFVLIYSALKDEIIKLNFFSKLLKENREEFLGCGVSGFFTNSGYYSDHITVCVFSGDFEATIFHEPIEYENLEETVSKIEKKIDKNDLLFIHSANTIDDNYYIEILLKQIQENNPKMQIVGGVSSPPPFIATKEGVFNDTIAFALFKGVNCSFKIDTGFEVDEKSSHEFKLTKVSGEKIFEINGRNAADEFQKIQHVRDYLFNQLVDMTLTKDIVELPKYFQKANEILYDAISKSYKDFLGARSIHGFMNAFLVLHINKNYIRVNSLWPEGAIIKRNLSTPKKHLEVYDRLNNKQDNGKAMILIDCAMRLFYYNYQTDEAYNKLKKIEYPFIAPQVYGEIGNYIPYHPKENILHNCTIKALVFR